MKTFQTHQLPQLDAHTQQLVYCALDSMLTVEIKNALVFRMDATAKQTYEFERMNLGPILDMMGRGFLIDTTMRDTVTTDLKAKVLEWSGILTHMVQWVWDKPDFNYRSNLQLQKLFYEQLLIPKIPSVKKGQVKYSLDRDSLERIIKTYSRGAPYARLILKLRDEQKVIEALSTELRNDRWFCSYNIGGTDTGRLSSSEHPLRIGANVQNIDDYIRRCFVADPGKILYSCDQQGAEARVVAYLSGDENYIKALEAGDVHTIVAGMVFGFEPRKELAERKYYRDMSYRDIAKRAAHGCLTEDHEVLTRQGWVPLASKPQEILTWSSTESRFAPVSHWTDFAYTGALIDFEGNSLSARMTSDHRFPYRWKAGECFKEAIAAEGPKGRMPLGSDYAGGNVVVPARLIAAYMFDGSPANLKSRFHLRKRRKVARLKELCNLYGIALEGTGESYCVALQMPKHPGSFMLDWTPECIDDFLDEYVRWDGRRSATAKVLFSTRREDLEWIQTLGRIRGIGGAISKPYTSVSGSPVFRLQQNRRKFATSSAVKDSCAYVEGVRVLCPTVPSSWFYVRRNGKIFVTGNSNYGGTPRTIAKVLKVELAVIEEFQRKYFRTFPRIRSWQEWTAREIQAKGYLTTPFGRRRYFWGRPWDDTIVRAAIAYVPQSTVSDLTLSGMHRLWTDIPDVQLLANGHDAAIFQVPEAGALARKDEFLRTLETPLQVSDYSGNVRRMVVPWEASVGWNWGKRLDKKDGSVDNPRGLLPYDSHLKSRP